MTANQSRLLGVALLLGTVSLIMYLARLNNAPDEDAAGRALAREALARKAEAEQEIAHARARLQAGAYVSSRGQLSPTETLQSVIIPESLSSEFDTRCVIYQNAELRTSSITCTGVLFRPQQPPPP